jgi:hypothetical protein
VPEPLSRAVHRAMEKDPDDRQQTMDDLAAELRAAAGLPAVVVRVSMRPPATSAPDTGPKVGPHGTVKIAGPESAAQLAPPKRACTTPNGFPPTAGPSPNRAREERRQADGASSAENGVPRGPIGATTHAVPPLFGPKRPAAVPTVPRASLAVAPTLVATARASWPGWKQAVCAAGFGGAVGVPMAIAMLWAMRGSPANPVAEATASSLPSSAAPAVSSAAAIQPIAEGGGDMNASIALAVTPEASAIALPRPERKAGPLAPSSSSVSKTWGRTRAPSAGAPSSKPPAAPSVVDGKRDPTRRIVGGPGRDASAPEPLGEPFF